MIWYVYVEGGGDRGALKPECRRGFSEFFRRAGISTSTFRVIACGSRDNAFRSFCTALEGGQRALLLVDSEDPVTAESAWAHLEARDRWVRPDGADEADCHLMAQCMESWFLADRDALASFFGADFNARALPGSPSASTASDPRSSVCSTASVRTPSRSNASSRRTTWRASWASPRSAVW